MELENESGPKYRIIYKVYGKITFKRYNFSSGRTMKTVVCLL